MIDPAYRCHGEPRCVAGSGIYGIAVSAASPKHQQAALRPNSIRYSSRIAALRLHHQTLHFFAHEPLDHYWQMLIEPFLKHRTHQFPRQSLQRDSTVTNRQIVIVLVQLFVQPAERLHRFLSLRRRNKSIIKTGWGARKRWLRSSLFTT